METKKFSIKAAFAFGWQKTKAEFIFLVSVGLVGGVISAVLNSVSKGEDAFSALAILASIVFGVFLNVGVIKILLAIIGNEKPTANVFFNITSSEFFRYVGCAILYGIAVIVGFLLLIIPGIIAIIRLQFGYYFLIEKNMGPLEALKESWRVTKGETFNLFVFGLLMIGLNIIGGLFFGIGLLVTVPVTMIAIVYIYKKLSGAALPQVADPILPTQAS